VNPYQEACRAIKQACDSGRYSELKEKVQKGTPGKRTIEILSAHPSRITNAWALLRIEKPVVPPALIRGAGKRGNGACRSLISIGGMGGALPVDNKKYTCKECEKEVDVIGLGGFCINCDPFFKRDELNTEAIAHG
jgi:hypothetical protein